MGKTFLIRQDVKTAGVCGLTIGILEIFQGDPVSTGTGGFDAENRRLTFRMSDSGVPFDPLKKPDPDITLSADERDIGGLGIFITKKTMDTVEYAYENGKNILTMIKEI